MRMFLGNSTSSFIYFRTISRAFKQEVQNQSIINPINNRPPIKHQNNFPEPCLLRIQVLQYRNHKCKSRKNVREISVRRPTNANKIKGRTKRTQVHRLQRHQSQCHFPENSAGKTHRETVRFLRTDGFDFYTDESED